MSRNREAIVWVGIVAALVVVFMVLFLGSMGAFDDSPDSAGLEYTELPYRTYRIGNFEATAFKLFNRDCVWYRGDLDCLDPA